MTFIQPKRNRGQRTLILSLEVLLFLVLAIAIIFLYARIVSLQHQIAVQEQLLGETRAANADLKNNFYQKLDVSNLSEIIQERGLIKIANPDYLGV